MRILLVEDDAQMNEALKIFFCKAGYTVLQAYNATEAERCLDKNPDVIIADIGLPGGWWHILYFRHMDNNGYGSQFAIGLDQTLQVYVRTSIGTGWSGWAPLPTLTASTVDIGAGAPLTNNQLYLVYE